MGAGNGRYVAGMTRESAWRMWAVAIGRLGREVIRNAVLAGLRSSGSHRIQHVQGCKGTNPFSCAWMLRLAGWLLLVG